MLNICARTITLHNKSHEWTNEPTNQQTRPITTPPGGGDKQNLLVSFSVRAYLAEIELWNLLHMQSN